MSEFQPSQPENLRQQNQDLLNQNALFRQRNDDFVKSNAELVAKNQKLQSDNAKLAAELEKLRGYPVLTDEQKSSLQVVEAIEKGAYVAQVAEKISAPQDKTIWLLDGLRNLGLLEKSCIGAPQYFINQKGRDALHGG